MFFSLKLHKLHYLNPFVGFNNILKKMSFSCYIKCNTSHFYKKNIYFFKKKDFSVFFPFISMFWMKMKEKSKIYINFSWQFTSSWWLENFISHATPKITDLQSFIDLRPVALTPIPSPICEDFVFHWSYSKIIEHIDVQQFGNIKVTFTSIYLPVNFLEFIHRPLDKRDTSLALAWWFQKSIWPCRLHFCY